jgi:hypothetical protein
MGFPRRWVIVRCGFTTPDGFLMTVRMAAGPSWGFERDGYLLGVGLPHHRTLYQRFSGFI